MVKKIMKRTVALAVLGILCAFSVAGQTPMDLDSAIQQAGRDIGSRLVMAPRVALLSINSPTDELSSYILRELSVVLESQRNSMVIARQDIDRVLAQMNLGVSSDVSDADAIQLGRRLNAQFVVTGLFESAGENYRFRTRLVHVVLGSVQGTSTLNVSQNPHLYQLLGIEAPVIIAAPEPPPATPVPLPVVPEPLPAAPVPAASVSPVQAGLRDGIYTFHPRVRAIRGGMGQNAYIDRVVVRGGFMNIYLVNVPVGAGSHSGIPHYGGRNSHIQDLDRPQGVFTPVREAEYSEAGSRFWVVTFEAVTATRFTVINTSQNPNLIFEEIILGEPD